jgi:hypothetical protein
MNINPEAPPPPYSPEHSKPEKTEGPPSEINLIGKDIISSAPEEEGQSPSLKGRAKKFDLSELNDLKFVKEKMQGHSYLYHICMMLIPIVGWIILANEVHKKNQLIKGVDDLVKGNYYNAYLDLEGSKDESSNSYTDFGITYLEGRSWELSGNLASAYSSYRYALERLSYLKNKEYKDFPDEYKRIEERIKKERAEVLQEIKKNCETLGILAKGDEIYIYKTEVLGKRPARNL